MIEKCVACNRTQYVTMIQGKDFSHILYLLKLFGYLLVLPFKLFMPKLYIHFITEMWYIIAILWNELNTYLDELMSKVVATYAYITIYNRTVYHKANVWLSCNHKVNKVMNQFVVVWESSSLNI